MDLDEQIDAMLQSGRKKRGGPAIFLGAEDQLTLDDVRDLAETPRAAENRPLVQIRQTHHQIARLMADGIPNVQISAIVGISENRISILKADPTFKELLAHYERNKEMAYASMHERLASLGFDTIETLAQRLEEKPDSIPTDTLVKLMETLLDRTGHGKQSSISVKSFSLSETRVTQLVQELGNGQVKKISSQDRGTLLREVHRQALAYSASEEVDGEECGGSGLREEGDSGVDEEKSGDSGVSPVD